MNIENLSKKTIERGESQRFFTVLESGKWRPDAIKTVITEPGTTMKRTSESEEILGTVWQTSIKKGLTPWPEDETPTRYRLAKHEEEVGSGDERTLVLTLDPTISYRDAHASQSEAFQEFVRSKGKEGKDYEPLPLAVTAVVVAKNTQGELMMMMTKRRRADYKLGGLHASLGGFLEIRKETDPTAAALRETEEEAALKEEEISSLYSAGLVHNPWTGGADLVYAMETDIPAEVLSVRQGDGENETFFIPLTRKKLQEWLLAPVHAAVAPALASVIMVGKEYIRAEKDSAGNPIDADAWAEEMLRALAWRSQDYDDPAVRESLEQRDIKRLEDKLRASSGVIKNFNI